MGIRKEQDGGAYKAALSVDESTTVGDVFELAAAALNTLSRIVPTAFELRVSDADHGSKLYACAFALCESLVTELHVMSQRVCLMSDVLEDELSGMAGIGDHKVVYLIGLNAVADMMHEEEARGDD